MINKLSAGARIWGFAGGHIPLRSTGSEPWFTSHDKIAILNPSDNEATVELTIFYSDAEPVSDYEIKVIGRRVRKIRFNDLVDPLPIDLDKPFGFVVTSNVEVIIQFSRMMTSHHKATGFCFTPYHKRYE